MWLPAGTFAFVLAVILGMYWVFVVRPETTDQRALRKRLKVTAARAARLGVLQEVNRFSHSPAFNRLLGPADRLLVPLQRWIAQSALRTTVGVLLGATAIFAFLAYVLVIVLTGQSLLGLLSALLAGMIPYLHVAHARNQRLRRFEERFPEAIDLIARALRAGHALTTGLKMVGDELPDPLGGEFRLLYDQQNYGLPLPEALKSFAERMPLLDARFFVTALLTQREAGGNLAEVLDHLAAVIRDRFRVRRQVRVLSAHGRMSGWILVALPPALALVTAILIPGHLTVLLHDPLGVRMVVGAVILQIAGTLVVRRIVTIRY